MDWKKKYGIKNWGFGNEINCELEYTPLKLNIVWILFKALAIGSGLAFGALFTELLFVYMKKKQSLKKKSFGQPRSRITF